MEIGIVGAGATGLTAAYELARRGHGVTVFEAAPEAGGLARDIVLDEDSRHDPLDMFYHHIFTSDSAVTELIEELGLGGRLEWFAPSNALYAAGGMHPFTTPLDLLRLPVLPLLQRIRLGLFVLRTQHRREWRNLEEVTAAEWARAQAGDEIYETIWKPLLRSKFGEHADEIGATWLWNKIRLRSSSRGEGGRSERLGYLRGGFGVLYRELVRCIESRGGTVRCGRPVRSLSREPKGLTITTDEGSTSVDRALLTVAPPLAAGLLPEAPEAYRSRLREVRYMANLCLTLESREPLVPWYWTSIADNGLPFVAIIGHTAALPAERYGRHITYLSRYLDEGNPLWDADDEAVRDAFLDGLGRITSGETLMSITGTHLFRARYAQPVVDRGYGASLLPHETPLPGLFLASMAQIYPQDRGQNYAIAMGRRAPSFMGLDEGETL
ncbi:MAG: NAD(P)/FAD-dependent oxidoreductase [Synergistales bacterium]|nr:NAD(P)/FAD-dependent oxidoreductase [Synergistales bacterium]